MSGGRVGEDMAGGREERRELRAEEGWNGCIEGWIV
jgi:hypothetical protein